MPTATSSAPSTATSAVLALREAARRPRSSTRRSVRERYGVEPTQVADLIALRGDPSDGLPGAPGIGAKTAAQMLSSHGSLDGVLAAARAGELRPRLASALIEDEAQLRDFLSIATLQRIDVSPPADTASDFAGGALAVEEPGMAQLAQRLARRPPGTPPESLRPPAHAPSLASRPSSACMRASRYSPRCS